MPTGEAKSYTIEEIICKAIKGIDGYKDILERYKRIVVTTIQNKLIDPYECEQGYIVLMKVYHHRYMNPSCPL